MKSSHRNLPEPDLPEHQLIRSVNTLPTLSSGLKQRVMAGCDQQMILATRQYRVRVVTSVLAACCLLIGLCRWIMAPSPAPARPQSDAVTESPAVKPGPSSTGGSLRYDESEDESSSSSSSIAADQVHPEPALQKRELQKQRLPARESDQIRQIIEDLQQRERKLSGVFPAFELTLP
jgi:hypothetical protein